MRVLLSWLREFAPIEGDPVELGEELSSLGLAVEEMAVVGEGLDGVVVARVLETRPHPDADRIHLVDVDAGDGEALQICCGAFNMAAGDLVPLATVGTVMPGGIEIARRKMRGQWSNGMLCSPDEIGLGDDHEGIMILPHDLEPGVPLAEALGIEPDVLYDLEVNPNRPDAQSVAGVARDLAARLGAPFALPVPAVETAGPDATGLIDVDIRDPDLCGRFVARVLHGTIEGASPPWLVNRLRALGQRPINRIVDVSNYVMLELGQPNHTFDLDKVSGGKLIVRRANEGERLLTLDGADRVLLASDGVIADGDDHPVSLAGVMGGASTEISATTSQILLEMAWWDPPSIARTSRRLALRSEASARFERGTDPEIADLAMLRFAELLAPAGAVLNPGQVDERGNTPEPARLRLRTSRTNELLGTEIPADDMGRHLSSIGFEVHPAGGDHDVVVPSFRPDTTAEIDLVEEVARLHGYSNIARTVPSGGRSGGLTGAQRRRRFLRAVLAGSGATEVMPLPFLAPGDLEAAGLGEDGIVVSNPLDAKESVMRSSLRPGLLKALGYNASHRHVGLTLFEIGRVWLPGSTGDLPDEREALGIALGGREAPAAVEAVDLVLDAVSLTGVALQQEPVPGLHPTRSARLVTTDGAVIGAVGEIDPAVLDAFQVPERVGWVELDLTTSFELPQDAHLFTPFSRQPSSDVDLAFVVADDVPAAAVEATLRQAEPDLLVSVELFDVFRSEQLGPESRSLAYALRFQAADRTLTDAEVGQARQRCIDAVVAAHGATLRGADA